MTKVFLRIYKAFSPSSSRSRLICDVSIPAYSNF